MFLTGFFAYATLAAMNDLPTVSRNIRYLLWRAKQNPEAWSSTLANWIGGSETRAKDLLNNARPSETELSALAEATQQEGEMILYGELFTKDEILKNNLATLIDGLEHGGQQALADHLGVNPSTISKWKTGKQQLHRKNLEELRRYFQIPESVDLAVDPIFLSLDPIGVVSLRKWVFQRLEAMPAEDLVKLFPALKRLFA